MAEQTEVIKLSLKVDDYLLKIQAAKDQIKELDKAIKELNKDSGARKELIIEKANAEKGLKQLQSELKATEKAIQNTAKSGKFSFMELWAGIQLGYGAFKKIVGALTGFKDAARDAVETNQKFKVVFSSIEKDAERMAKSLAEAFDLSDITAKKLLSDTGNLLIGFGMTEDAALKMSFSINTIAQDLVSFTNYSGGTEAAAQALTSAMTGNTRAAKSLGIVIRQENQEFKSRVKYLQENNGLTQQAATSTAIYEQIVQQTQKSVGDYARTHDQLANTERRRQEVQKEVAEYMGKQLVPIFTTWNNVAANFMKLLLPDEFKNVSIEIKAAHDKLVELRTQLQGLTKDQLEKKLAEVTAELAKIEESATGANNVFNSYNQSIKNNANALTLQTDLLSKYGQDLADSINLTKINTQASDALAGSTKKLATEDEANAVAVFNLRDELKTLQEQYQSLIDPQNAVIDGLSKLGSYYKLNADQIKESLEEEKRLWDESQKEYEERAKRVEQFAKEKAEAEKQFADEVAKEEKRLWDESEAEYKSRLDRITQYEKDKSEEKIRIAEAEAARKKQIEQDRMQAANLALSAANDISQIQLNIIDTEYEKKKAALDKQYANEIITKEQYERKLAKLDAKKKKEEKAAKLQAKAWAITEIGINTWVEASKAWSKPWLVAAIIAAGVAAAAKVSTAKFAKGVKDFKVPEGYPNDSYPIFVESGERVNVETKSQQRENDRKRSFVNPYVSQSVNSSLGSSRPSGGAFSSGASTERIENLLESLNRNIASLDISVNVNNTSKGAGLDKLTTEITRNQERFKRAGGNLADR